MPGAKRQIQEFSLNKSRAHLLLLFFGMVNDQRGDRVNGQLMKRKEATVRKRSRRAGGGRAHGSAVSSGSPKWKHTSTGRHSSASQECKHGQREIKGIPHRIADSLAHRQCICSLLNSAMPPSRISIQPSRPPKIEPLSRRLSVNTHAAVFLVKPVDEEARAMALAALKAEEDAKAPPMVIGSTSFRLHQTKV